MTRTSALEFAARGIRVNAVCPAPVETRMMRALERGLDPADPQGPEAAYITGGIYSVDGGLTA